MEFSCLLFDTPGHVARMVPIAAEDGTAATYIAASYVGAPAQYVGFQLWRGGQLVVDNSPKVIGSEKEADATHYRFYYVDQNRKITDHDSALYYSASEAIEAAHQLLAKSPFHGIEVWDRAVVIYRVNKDEKHN